MLTQFDHLPCFKLINFGTDLPQLVG